MFVYRITPGSIKKVAAFMARIKPEWWNAEGAAAQLSGGTGWYLGHDEDTPLGWLMCRSYECYKTAEIECLGYFDGSNCVISSDLQMLIDAAQEWAKGQGFVNMRFVIGSRGLSCHGRMLRTPWEELGDLHAVDREEYGWFLSMGFVPSGLLPNIYGDGYHGVLLVKPL